MEGLLVLIWKDLQDTLNRKTTKTRSGVVYSMLPFTKGKREYVFLFLCKCIQHLWQTHNRGCWWREEMRGRGGRRGQTYPCMAFWTLVSFEASEFYLFKEWNTDTNIQQSKATLCGACTGAWRLIKMLYVREDLGDDSELAPWVTGKKMAALLTEMWVRSGSEGDSGHVMF